MLNGLRRCWPSTAVGAGCRVGSGSVGCLGRAFLPTLSPSPSLARRAREGGKQPHLVFSLRLAYYWRCTCGSACDALERCRRRDGFGVWALQQQRRFAAMRRSYGLGHHWPLPVFVGAAPSPRIATGTTDPRKPSRRGAAPTNTACAGQLSRQASTLATGNRQLATGSGQWCRSRGDKIKCGCSLPLSSPPGRKGGWGDRRGLHPVVGPASRRRRKKGEGKFTPHCKFLHARTRPVPVQSTP